MGWYKQVKRASRGSRELTEAVARLHARHVACPRAPAWLGGPMATNGMWSEPGTDPRAAIEAGRGERAVLAEYLDHSGRPSR